MRQLTDELRDNWGLAYQHLFVQFPPPAYIEQFSRFKQEAGMTDRLIVAVIERAIETKRRHPLAWVQTVLAGLVPYDVKTPEDWAEFEAQQVMEDAKQAQNIAANDMGNKQVARMIAKREAGQSQGGRPASNVFLKREKKDDSYYDHIFKKFDN